MRYDFRARLRLSIDDIGGEGVPFRHAIDYIEALLRDSTSMTFLSVNNWEQPASFGDVTLLGLLRAFISVHLEKNARMPNIPGPWRDPNYVSPEEFEAARAELERRTALQG